MNKASYDEPLEYTRGFADFLGCKIDLSKKPLIPRRETEFWVEKSIHDILIFSRMSECVSINVLDIFAGSGCIGIAVLKHVKNCYITFADKDKKCLEQIKINLKINKENNGTIDRNKKKVRVVESDVFSKIRRKFDYIFANPPYVAEKLKHKVQESVLKHEPKNALFGGLNGLFYIKKFLKQAKNYLKPRGKIFMEFSPEQKEHIENLLRYYKYKNWEFRRDQYSKWRWVVIL